MKKLVFILNQEVYPYELEVEDSVINLKSYFLQVFTKELQDFADYVNSKDFKGFAYDEQVPKIKENLLSLKIFKDDVLPWYSQGYLQYCWFTQENNKLVVDIPSDLQVFTLEEWFDKNK